MNTNEEHLEARLDAARAGYGALRYPGDLARDVGVRRRPVRGAVLFTFKTLAAAAVLLVALLVGLVILVHHAERSSDSIAPGGSSRNLGAFKASLKPPSVKVESPKPGEIIAAPTFSFPKGALPGVGSWSIQQVLLHDLLWQNQHKERTS